MNLQQMAERVLQAKHQGDLRYQEFMGELSKRTGRHPSECEHITFMLAMGMQL